MIDDKDSNIPSPLIMFTSTALRHALLEWQKNTAVPPKASKLKMKADRPDRSNYFNNKNDSGEKTSCYAAMDRKLLTSPGIADMCTFLINTWNTLPQSFQQRGYKNTLATVKCQIQQAENPTPADVISMEAARHDNAILLDYVTSEVALENPEIRSTDANISIDNNCTDYEQHFGMPGGSKDYVDEGDKINESHAIPTATQRRCATTSLVRFDLRTSNVNGYKGIDGNNAEADEEEEASQADNGSMQNLED